MKFILFKHWEDYGHEFTLRVLSFKRFCVFHLSLHHSVYFDWKEANLHASVSILGRSNLFALSLNFWNITIDMGLFGWYLYYED